MKNVLLKTRFDNLPLHSLYENLIKNPPEGYRIISPTISEKYSTFSTVSSKYHNPYYKTLWYHTAALPYIIAQLTQTQNRYDVCDMIYASQHILSTKKPWVVDLEYSDALAGHANITLCKNIISRKLKSKNCKAIMPWSNWAKETLVKSIDCTDFLDKIKVIRYTATPKKILANKKDESIIRILFLGSTNIANKNSFEYKGAYETLNAFIDLQKKYDNLELVIRSIVSSQIKEKAKKYHNIKILEEPLPAKELENLFSSSHIFSRPSYEVPSSSVLEAMSYGLPVITTSLYNTPEIIDHMKNGFLIDLPNSNAFYTKSGTPKDYSKTFTDTMRALRDYTSNKVKEYFKLLIENSSLRNKIGKEAMRTIEEGEFSIKHKNKLLKEIFDIATS